MKKPSTIIAITGTARNRRGPARTIVAAVGEAGKGRKPGRKRTDAKGGWLLDNESIERTTGHHVEGPEAVEWLRTGAKQRRRENKGGRPPGSPIDDVNLAREWKHGERSGVTKAKVAERHGLHRSTGTRRINRGLQILKHRISET
jgi:hypothetical protein